MIMTTLYAVALLCVNNEVVLVRRYNADFASGLYSMVGGKVEMGETARQAVRREVQEEVGLDLPEERFELVHTFHRKGNTETLVALCFKADITGLKPINNEPHKHDDMRFFPLDKLPENIIPAHKQAIDCVLKGIAYSEHGW
ncbi:MAG TPA: NUDIX domain-containing protein [Candidatus Babeliales bacterium]|nr:NUDIX domain-containing protein [Candidatus Babeliales bacterium]